MSEMEPGRSEHQILADGEVIYSGPNWANAFLDAAFHSEYRRIVHLEDGKTGASWGPVLHGPPEGCEETHLSSQE